MKLFLVTGYVVRRVGEFTSNVQFEGFVESYSIGKDVIQLDEFTHPAGIVVIEKIQTVETGTCQRLKIVTDFKDPAAAKPTPVELFLNSMKDEFTRLSALKHNARSSEMLLSMDQWIEIVEARLLVAERSRDEFLESLLIGAKREFMASLRAIYQAL